MSKKLTVKSCACELVGFCYFSFVEFEFGLEPNWLVDMCAAFWDSYITIPADSAAFAAIVGQCRYEPSLPACYL